MRCYYHSSDYDGKCSGAIVQRKYPNCDLIPINYGDKFNHKEVQENETVFIVDFSIPDEDLIQLCQGHKVIWIDHHDSVINKHESSDGKDVYNNNLITVLDNTNQFAATELVWTTLFPNEKIPYGVKLIADYDMWIHTNIHTVYLDYGLNLRDIKATDVEFWKLIFEEDHETMKFLLSNGQIINAFQEQRHHSMRKRFAFVTEFEGHTALAINAPGEKSKILEPMFNPKFQEFMIVFGRNGKYESWTVSLYGGKDCKVHLGDLATKYGGGGRQGTASFQLSGGQDLPFKH